MLENPDFMERTRSVSSICDMNGRRDDAYTTNKAELFDHCQGDEQRSSSKLVLYRSHRPLRHTQVAPLTGFPLLGARFLISVVTPVRMKQYLRG
jgi:hypothetical protein